MGSDFLLPSQRKRLFQFPGISERERNVSAREHSVWNEAHPPLSSQRPGRHHAGAPHCCLSDADRQSSEKSGAGCGGAVLTPPFLLPSPRTQELSPTPNWVGGHLHPGTHDCLPRRAPRSALPPQSQHSMSGGIKSGVAWKARLLSYLQNTAG